MSRALSRLIDPLLLLPICRPIVTLVVTVAFTLVAIVAISRLKPDTSIVSMFSRNDPAAQSLVQVLDGYSAAEELLVLVTVPDTIDSPNAPRPARLVEFAKRFEQSLTTSPDAAALVEAVIYRADADTKKFFQDILAPAGIFYLDDAAFAQARQRLTPEGMRQQLARNESLLAQPGPTAAAAAKALLQDPLRLHEFLKAKLASAGSFATFGGDDALIAPDGRALLVRVVGRRPPSDLDFSRSLVAAAKKATEGNNIDGLNISMGGAYAIATASEQAIRADSISSVGSAITCLIALFVVMFRRPLRLLFLAIVPLALGSVLGFGAYVLFATSVTMLSAAVGAMMVGMGLDYSVHYLTHYEKRRSTGQDPKQAASDTSRDLFAALFAAWLTSVMGFAVVGWSDIPALGDFALLGSFGLAGVFVASLAVIPALLVLMDRAGARSEGNRARLRLSVEPLLAWIACHARASILTSTVVFAVALAIGLFLPGPILPLEPDLSVMHPRPNPALETQDEIARRFGAVPGSLLVHLRADTSETLVAMAHAVERRLNTAAVRDAGVAGTIGLATVLPDPAIVRRRLTEIGPLDGEKAAADFRAALADSAFDASVYEPYVEFLQKLLSRREAPTVSDVLDYRRLGQMMLPSSALRPGASPPTEAITLVSMNRSIDERARRAAAVEAVRTALSDVPGATLTGLPVLGHDTEDRVAQQVPRVFGLSLALVLAYVFAHFRSIRDAILSLSTAVFGMVILLAIMRIAHVRLNMINLIALPLLIGMTVDYGIFLVSLARLGRRERTSPEDLREHVASSAQAVLVCAGATLLGFGSLAFTSVPAVQSLGIVVAVGMAAALAGALFLLTPILLRART
jgi:predicted RND superfamily exporter protein